MLQLNLGSADLNMPKPWINIDIYSEGTINPDLVLDVRELDDHFGPGSVDEIYGAHLIEHLTPIEIKDAVKRWVSVLKPGGVLTIVTPDFRVIADRYLRGEEGFDLDRLIDVYVFSYCQTSHHASLHDLQSLTRILEEAGMVEIEEIDRMADPRLAYPADWQVGVTGRKVITEGTK